MMGIATPEWGIDWIENERPGPVWLGWEARPGGKPAFSLSALNGISYGLRGIRPHIGPAGTWVGFGAGPYPALNSRLGSNQSSQEVAGLDLAEANERVTQANQAGSSSSEARPSLSPQPRYQVGQIATAEVRGEWQFTFRPIRAVHFRNGAFWYMFEEVDTGYRESDVVLVSQIDPAYTRHGMWSGEAKVGVDSAAAKVESQLRLELEIEVEQLRQRVAELEAQLGAGAVRIESLQQQVRRLEEQLAEAQRAGKRQATPFARKKRQASPKRPGRKAGQGEFKYRPKPRPEDAQHTLEAPLDACPECGGQLRARKTHEHYEVDIPPVQPIVTRYVTHSGYCQTCRKRVHSRHPDQISDAAGAAGVTIGPRAKAIATDLKHRLGVSYAKTCEHMQTSLGLQVTPGALSQADKRLAKKARSAYEALVATLRACAVVHSDETGWRIGILTAWLWVFTNRDITVYTIRRSRGHEVVLDILGREFKGILVSDCLRTYDAQALADWLKQKCVGHLLNDLSEIEASKQGRAIVFARDVTNLLREALALKAAKPELAPEVFNQRAADLETRLDGLIDKKRRMTDPDNRRFAKRLRKQRPHLLRFLYVDELDATNNIAERQLRPPIVTRKTGGCNRTEEGAEAHAILSSLLATCRQQKRPILDYLVELQRASGEIPALLPESMRAPSAQGPP